MEQQYILRQTLLSEFSFFGQNVTGTSNAKTFSSSLYINPSYDDNQGNANGGKTFIINNTFENFDERNGFAVSNQSQGQTTKAFVYNNIFGSNISNKTSGYIGPKADAYIGYNLYQSEKIYFDNGATIRDNSNNLETENLGFKDRSNRNYSLKPSSPAINAGAFSYSADVFDELGNSNAPQVDRRN